VIFTSWVHEHVPCCTSVGTVLDEDNAEHPSPDHPQGTPETSAPATGTAFSDKW